jgi:hypothetical protein
VSFCKRKKSLHRGQMRFGGCAGWSLGSNLMSHGTFLTTLARCARASRTLNAGWRADPSIPQFDSLDVEYYSAPRLTCPPAASSDPREALARGAHQPNRRIFFWQRHKILVSVRCAPPLARSCPARHLTTEKTWMRRNFMAYATLKPLQVAVHVPRVIFLHRQFLMGRVVGS